MPTNLKDKPMKQPVVEDLPQPLMSYEEVSRRSTIALKERGWVCWQCSALENDVIIIVRDEEVSGYPAGYPVYTECEVKEVVNMSGSGMRMARLVNEAKKISEGGD